MAHFTRAQRSQGFGFVRIVKTGFIYSLVQGVGRGRARARWGMVHAANLGKGGSEHGSRDEDKALTLLESVREAQQSAF